MIDRVEDYLDRLFDLLAGAGRAGRRALAEAQGHLEEAVEANKAAGMSQEDAERDAITRFGSPEQIARAHLSVRALAPAAALGRIIAAAWLMAGVAGLAFGLMGLIDAAMAGLIGPGFIVNDTPDAIYSASYCHGLGVITPDQEICRAASVAHHAREMIDRPLVAGAFGLFGLGLFALARRAPALRAVTTLPNAAMVATAGAVAFCGGGGFVLLYAVFGLVTGERAEVGQHLAEGAAAILAGLVFLPSAWRAVRGATAE